MGIAKIIILFLLLLVSAFDSTAQFETGEPVSLIDQIIADSRMYLGKPYRHRTPEGRVLDCSGYMSHIFSKHGIHISGASHSVAKGIIRIPLDEVQVGDLLFFKGRNVNSSNVGHVSMVIEKDGDRLKMIHSCQRGILIDDYPMPYYSRRYLFAGRVPEIDQYHRETLSGKIQSDSILIKTSGIPDKIMRIDTIAAPKSPPPFVTVIGVGDIMPGTNYPSAQYLPPNDGKDILEAVSDILRDADVTFGNLEGVLLTGTGPAKKCSNPNICYVFKTPEHYVNYIRDAGFDVLSVANNHSGDFGDLGRRSTVKTLEGAGINFAGFADYPYTVFTKDSITYGFCAFAPNTGTIPLNNYSSLMQIVSHLDTLADIVIVSFHGGGEGDAFRKITRKNEFFIGEDRGNPYEFARVAIDAGADIVFGHGPHVTRAIDLYKDRFIAYSLGNFATYGRFNLTGSKGLAPIIKVTVNLDGSFKEAQIISAKQTGRGIPVPDEEGKVLKEIISLTKGDFPESQLMISEDGKVVARPPQITDSENQ